MVCLLFIFYLMWYRRIEPTQILPNGQAVHRVCSTTIGKLSMCPPPLPSMLVVAFTCSQTHKHSQWALCTAEAVSRFFEHVRNAPSLKKISIFVSIFSQCRVLLPIWHNNKVKGEEATIEFIRNAHTLSPSIFFQSVLFSLSPTHILRIERCDRCLMWNQRIKFWRLASLLAPAPGISLVLPLSWSVLLLHPHFAHYLIYPAISTTFSTFLMPICLNCSTTSRSMTCWRMWKFPQTICMILLPAMK